MTIRKTFYIYKQFKNCNLIFIYCCKTGKYPLCAKKKYVLKINSHTCLLKASLVLRSLCAEDEQTDEVATLREGFSYLRCG